MMEEDDANQILDLEDLDDFDASMLADMMEAGLQIPDVDDILQQAQDTKISAIAFKNWGITPKPRLRYSNSKR